MDEAVSASQVHEGPETADACDLAHPNLAFGKLFDQSRFLFVPHLLNSLSLREYGPIASSINLQNFHLEGFAYVLSLRFFPGGVNFWVNLSLTVLIHTEMVAGHADKLGHWHKTLHALNFDD